MAKPFEIPAEAHEMTDDDCESVNVVLGSWMAYLKSTYYQAFVV